MIIELKVESIKRYEGVFVDVLETNHVARVHVDGELPIRMEPGSRLRGAQPKVYQNPTGADMLELVEIAGLLEFAGPCPAEILERTLRSSLVDLPEAHRKLLAASNGLQGYGGYYRIFGVGPESPIDALTWNEPDVRKFAWHDDLSEFFCFGETGWGDQYAYRHDEMGEYSEPPVYFLESVTMTSERLASSFEQFITDEFLPATQNPYDLFLVAARNRLGELDSLTHITYSPSILLTGEEKAEHITQIPAVVSMVVNGDLARQLGHEDPSRQVEAIRPYTDERGRERLDVVWGD